MECHSILPESHRSSQAVGKRTLQADRRERGEAVQAESHIVQQWDTGRRVQHTTASIPATDDAAALAALTAATIDDGLPELPVRRWQRVAVKPVVM